MEIENLKKELETIKSDHRQRNFENSVSSRIHAGRRAVRGQTRGHFRGRPNYFPYRYHHPY